MTGQVIDAQLEIPGADKFKRPETQALAVTSHMELLQFAIQNNSAIDVIERIAALQEKAIISEAELKFNEAMNACQSELGPIGTDMENTQTRSRYASYAKLDRAVRKIYTKHGLSLSFSEEDSQKPDHTRIICYVSKGRHTRIYRKDMPVVTTGPQGKAVMTLTHATGSADAYGRRYLLKDIFNLAIGEEDTDGNGPEPAQPPKPKMSEQEFKERAEFFPKCSTLQELHDHWHASYGEAKKIGDRDAMNEFNRLKDERKKVLMKDAVKS